MGPVPVVEVLSLIRLSFQIGVIELDAVGLLRALHLPIQVWGARADRSELDMLVSQRLLERDGEELTTPVSLDPLDREWQLFDHPFLKKPDGIRRCPAFVEAQHTHPGTIIDSSELDASWGQLHGVELYPVSWNWARVSGWTPRPSHTLDAVAVQDLPDRGRGKRPTLHSQEFRLDPLRPKVTLPTQLQDRGSFFSSDHPRRRSARSAAA